MIPRIVLKQAFKPFTGRQFTTRIKNATVATPTPTGAVNVYNGNVFFNNGKIQGEGNVKDIDTVIDAEHRLVTPGLIDPHTHLAPPIGRSKEFSMRPTHSYQQIASEGGGILSSVRATQAATEKELFNANQQIIEQHFLHGTTTLEIKSGYGLETSHELKQLRVMRELRKHFESKVDIIPTYLGAHAVPDTFKNRSDEFVDEIIKSMPYIKQDGLAEFVDVFCEKGYFSTDQSKRILQAAKENGFGLRMHADEFFPSTGGADLAGKLNASSADHLMAVSEAGIRALSETNVTAVLLPGTTLFLGKNTYAPARKLIDGGVKVALATDNNPGSSMFASLPFMMQLGMTQMKMTLHEVFLAVTINAALSLNRPNVESYHLNQMQI